VQSDPSLLARVSIAWPGILASLGAAALACVAAALAARSARPRTPRAARLLAAGSALAVGLGYAAGHAASLGVPDLPRVVGVHERLFVAALAAALAGAADALLRARWRPLLRAAAGLGVPWFLLAAQREHRWGTGEALGWTALLGAAIALAWTGLDALERRRARRGEAGVTPLALLVAAAALVPALEAGASASLALVAGSLATALALAAAAALFARRFGPLTAEPTARGAIGPAVLLASGLALSGRFTAELPAASAALCALAPVAAWLVEPRSSDAGAPRFVRRVALALAAVALVAGLGLVLALCAAPEPYAG
jgi:hypothetical protein